MLGGSPSPGDSVEPWVQREMYREGWSWRHRVRRADPGMSNPNNDVAPPEVQAMIRRRMKG
jgi:hypothetical protein